VDRRLENVGTACSRGHEAKGRHADAGLHDDQGLRDAPQEVPATPLEFAGYRLHTSLEILNWEVALTAEPPSYVGIWKLLQLPFGVEIVIPTYCRNESMHFFGEIPSADIQVDDRAIRYAMREKGEQKISVRALASTGRARYTFRQGAKSCLVVRNFSINPSGK
jgi:hypothetical protein